MGKLIRNGIEYGGGNGTDIFEVTQAEYDALKQAGTLVHNALYVISDGDNLNPTANDIEYSSGVTVKQAIDSKQDESTLLADIFKKYSLTGTTNSSGDITFDYKPVGQCIIVSATKVRNSANSNIGFTSIGRNAANDRYIIHLQDASGNPLASQSVEVIVHYVEIY